MMNKPTSAQNAPRDPLSAKLAALLTLSRNAKHSTIAAVDYEMTASESLPTLIRAIQVALTAQCLMCGGTGTWGMGPCGDCAWKREMQKVLEEL